MDGTFPAGIALPVAKARLKIGGIDVAKPVAADDKAATFRVDLPAGETQIQTWFYDASGKVQPARDRNTAAIRTETTAEGTITRENGNTAKVSRRGTMMTTARWSGRSKRAASSRSDTDCASASSSTIRSGAHR